MALRQSQSFVRHAMVVDQGSTGGMYGVTERIKVTSRGIVRFNISDRIKVTGMGIVRFNISDRIKVTGRARG